MTPEFALFACLAAGACLASLYLCRGAAAEVPAPAAVFAKTCSVVLLSLGGLLAAAPLHVTVGLALCALGDYLITRRGNHTLEYAIAAFALGHLSYADWMYTPENAMRMLWVLPLVALAISTEFWLLPRTFALKFGVRIYIWIITFMAARALTLPYENRLAIIGAALFVFSDLLLALRLFVARDPGRQRLLSLLLWPAYWLGQALILLGSLGYP